MTATAPNDAATGVDAQYRQALDQGRFLIQHCTACDRAVFYPRMLCPCLLYTSPSPRDS